MLDPSALEPAVELTPMPVPVLQPVLWPKRLQPRELYHIRCCIYGAPGVGKTRLAATAPRPFFFACDPEGTLSIVDSNHLYWDINSMGDLRQAWNWMADNLDEFDTIVMDSLTTLQSFGMDEIVDPSLLYLQRRSYGESTRQMRAVILGLCRFPKNVVFIATERLRDDEIRHLRVVVPNLTPRVGSLLADNVRLIGRIYAERVQVEQVWTSRVCLQVTNDGRSWAKDTSGKLPQVIINPNLTEIFEAMQGKATT